MPRHDTKRRDTLVILGSGVGVPTTLRLPYEARFWSWAVGVNAQLVYNYGGVTVPGELAAPGGFTSPAHVYPGNDCELQFFAVVGSPIMVFWTG